jgi:hypothetical protein
LNIELCILKSFFNKVVWKNYKDYLDFDFIKSNNKELYKLFTCVSLFHETYPEKDIPGVPDLELFYFQNYPTASKKEQYELEPLFKRISEAKVDSEVIEGYLTSHRQRTTALRLSLRLLEVCDGKVKWEEIVPELKAIAESTPFAALAEEQNEFVGDDLDLLYTKVKTGGLYWRLDRLNESLGPLRVGDFGFVFARPESGKTTFLADQVAFMAGQCDRPIIWFNNEEQGEKVVSRLYQATFGITTGELFGNLEKWKSLYSQGSGSKCRVFDRATIRYSDVDRICAKYNPGLIVIDQIDKVKGFSEDRNDLELKAKYQWARELAKTYGPVIAVCQAGGTGEGKKWLTMDDVDSSKTAKQGEADWILGIGKSHNEGMEAVRHFCISKNKLLGDSNTIPELRHGKFDVLIKPEIARYQDL